MIWINIKIDHNSLHVDDLLWAVICTRCTKLKSMEAYENALAWIM